MQGALWEVWQNWPANNTQKNKKKPYLKLVAILEIEGATGSWKPTFTKIRALKKLYANMRSLNDYGLIISIKANKKAHVYICFISEIGDTTSMQIYFPILVHALKWF